MTVSEPAPPLGTKKRLFYGLGLKDWAIYRSTWLAWRAVDRTVFRTRVQGLEGLDPDGPTLLLSNHVGMLDPFWVALHLWRPSRFMAATSVLKIPVLGPYLGALGAFPKMKFVKDRDSMRTLAEHYDNGHVVTLFPEGLRSWTGRPGEIHEGIGRLIKRLDARVIFGRIRSGYLVHPRWAKYPRYIPVDIDYHGPVRYPAHLSPEAITADVRQHLHVEPRRDPSRFAFGFRLAEGLPTLLWACPRCFALDGLQVDRRDRDCVRCETCRSRWRLDLDTVLHGEDGVESMTVAEAHDRIEAHFGRPPVLEPDRYRSDGVVAVHPRATLHHVPHRGKQRPVASGALHVQPDGVHLHHDGGPWRAPFSELLSVSTEVAGQVFLRRASEDERGELFRLEVPDQSSYKWGRLLKDWLHHHRGELPTPSALAQPEVSKAGP